MSYFPHHPHSLYTFHLNFLLISQKENPLQIGSNNSEILSPAVGPTLDQGIRDQGKQYPD
jgi:hypothetical protein